MGFSIVAIELELVEVGETQIEGLLPFNEQGVERTHHVLEKAFGGVENLHGCMQGRRKVSPIEMRFAFAQGKGPGLIYICNLTGKAQFAGVKSSQRMKG
ncbi:hypothetical protein E2542_SST25431 [Spatholobus suberectus]|nr:hypothetical protein E2542_SST25431 [Spatholobus suberectus]